MWSPRPGVSPAPTASNPEIAAELYIEPFTVKTHVAHALGKLALPDRVAAVIYAYERGLLTPGGGPPNDDGGTS